MKMEGNFDLPTESSRLHLNEVIKSILNEENFDLKISMGSSVGDNYNGVVYRVVATINEHQNSTNDIDCVKKRLSLIVKLPPRNAARREQFFARPSFIKEIWIYDEVRKTRNFKKLFNSKSILMIATSAV